MEARLGFGPFITLSIQSTSFEFQMLWRKGGCFAEVGCFAGEGTCVIGVYVLKRDVSIVSKELVALMEEEGYVSMWFS